MKLLKFLVSTLLLLFPSTSQASVWPLEKDHMQFILGLRANDAMAKHNSESTKLYSFVNFEYGLMDDVTLGIQPSLSHSEHFNLNSDSIDYYIEDEESLDVYFRKTLFNENNFIFAIEPKVSYPQTIILGFLQGYSNKVIDRNFFQEAKISYTLNMAEKNYDEVDLTFTFGYQLFENYQFIIKNHINYAHKFVYQAENWKKIHQFKDKLNFSVVHTIYNAILLESGFYKDIYKKNRYDFFEQGVYMNLIYKL